MHNLGLTKDVENDYIAEVSSIGNTVRNEDIARTIVEDGSKNQGSADFNLYERSFLIIHC